MEVQQVSSSLSIKNKSDATLAKGLFPTTTGIPANASALKRVNAVLLLTHHLFGSPTQYMVVYVQCPGDARATNNGMIRVVNACVRGFIASQPDPRFEDLQL
jgi:hypothetical protein